MRTRTGVALAASVALAAAANAHAATFTVTRLDDPMPGVCDSDCSLREAVRAVDAGSGGDTIALPLGRFRLTIAGAGEDAAATGDLDLTKSVTITGAGARQTLIDGTGIDRVFDVASGVTALIADVTVTGGLVNGDGGGIASAGTLTLLRDTIANNEAIAAGNNAGGGVDSTGILAVTQSTISGNRAYNGGGINFSGTATIADSTIAGNRAGGLGSNGDGGGISGSAGSSLALTGSTVADNHAFNGAGSGGGIDVPAATLKSSIVANNRAHETSGSASYVDNCSHAATSNGRNLSDGHDCGLTATGDLQDVDPRLGPLQDNGGPTDTEALLAGSPAIDAGDTCGTLDQRGTTRPRGASCDIGPYEFAPPIVTTTLALGIGLTSASLRGTVTPSSQATGYSFEYGTTTAYGAQTQALFLPPPSNSQVAVSFLVAGLKQGTSYHFRLVASNADGSSRGTDQSFTTNDRTKPVLTLLKVAPGIFRAAKGTTISFSLSEAATVTFKVDRVLPGIRKGRRCVAKTARRRRGRACTRYVPVKGTLTQAGTAGANSVAFDAKLGGKLLRPAAYRLSASPRDPGLNVGKT
ncbi:MAG TPA: choice-of-anchor Q domain-containing protein, partial [Gaiellaceae bacterium]